MLIQPELLQVLSVAFSVTFIWLLILLAWINPLSDLRQSTVGLPVLAWSFVLVFVSGTTYRRLLLGAGARNANPCLGLEPLNGVFSISLADRSTITGWQSSPGATSALDTFQAPGCMGRRGCTICKVAGILLEGRHPLARCRFFFSVLALGLPGTCLARHHALHFTPFYQENYSESNYHLDNSMCTILNRQIIRS